MRLVALRRSMIGDIQARPISDPTVLARQLPSPIPQIRHLSSRRADQRLRLTGTP